MTALDRKLLRDLWRLRGQVLAIALIVASGVGLLIMALSSLEALRETAAAYYERYRFAEVFASVKRAPETLTARIAALPGVQTAESRIVEFAVIDVADFAEPVIGQLVSIPERGQPTLNRLAMRNGRWVAPGRVDEVIVSEPFAEAHGLDLGDSLDVVMRGNKRELTVVGTALSPEFVYAIGPGALMPDEKRFGILWMGREALAAAYDLDGAFNDITVSLLRGANESDVVDGLDRLLESYGGVGAYARADQISNWFLMNELEQQRTQSRVMPTIFLTVAAFLVNMVLARLIAIERSEIGLLKAFGYGNWAIGWHYAKLVVVMAGLGVLIGWLVGYLLGQYNTRIFADLYRFPFLLYRPGPDAFFIAALVSLGAALLGAVGAVRKAIALAPAESMRPPAPPLFRKSWFGDSVFANWLDQPTRMILRHLLRAPLRAFLTTTGIALSVAVLTMALQWLDAVDHMVEVYFFQGQRQDITVALADAEGSRVLGDLRQLPGVMTVEPQRFVAANLRSGTRHHRGSVIGVTPEAELELVYDASGAAIEVPPGGLVLSDMLAEKLDVGIGDDVTVEILEGRRPLLSVPVVATFETYIGMMAYMDLAALNRLLQEPRRVQQANLLVDEAQADELFAELKELPQVSAVVLRRASVDIFYDTMGEIIYIFVAFFTGFACTLAIGVTYNMARISLSERGRELATLRVLGFRRWEVSYILLGEIGLLIFVALPLGCLCGLGLAWIITEAMRTELFRVPLVIEPATYGWAILVVLVAALVSGLLVRRRLDRLDLIAVLKTRE